MNKTLAHFILVGTCLLFAGCASTPPLTSSSDESSAKGFAANPQRAMVYIYADFAPIHTHNIPVVIDTQIAAQLGGGTFLLANLAPGKYTFTSVGGADNPPLTLDVQAGRVYFLRMHQLFGYGYLGGAEYIPVNESEGRKEVLKRRRVPVMLKPSARTINGKTL
jgi:hypothetical protein